MKPPDQPAVSVAAASETPLNAALRGVQTPIWLYPACFAVVLLAYLFQATVPALNEDDVNQVQNDGPSALLGSGRWIYALVYTRFMDHNPMPVASSVFGLAMLIAASVQQARLIGLRTIGARVGFVLIACVSIHYQHLFSFDSTRLVYPAANLLMATGLVLTLQRDALHARLAGLAMIALAPAIYQAALMLGAATVLLAAANWAAREGWRAALQRAGVAAVYALGGMALYAIMTEVVLTLTNSPKLGRIALDPTGVVSNAAFLFDLFRTYSIGLFTGARADYFPAVYYVFTTFFLAAYGGFVVWPLAAGGRKGAALVAAGAGALLLISPYCLAFITRATYYPPRSLYAFATVYAGLSALVLDRLLADGSTTRLACIARRACLAAAGGFVLLNMALISQRSYDEYLAWQSDRLIVERILSRIDDVMAADGAPSFAPSRESAAPEEIPLAVFGVQYWRAGPRGRIQTLRLFRWSRERVFQLLDTRFVKASREARARVRPALDGRAPWPAADSVFFEDGVLVVLLSDEGIDYW